MGGRSPSLPGQGKDARRRWKAAAIALLLLLASSSARGETFDTFLEPSRTVDISSAFRDRLDGVHVKDGQKVAAGEPLAELGTRVLLAQRALAREAVAFHGAIDSARALIKMRANRLAMLQDLAKSGDAKPQEMMAAQTELEIARAQLQSASEEQLVKKHELMVIEAQLEEKKLRSPIAGVVIKVNRHQAELVGGSDPLPLMTIVQLDPLKAVFHLPRSLTAAMAPGQPVTLESAGVPMSGEIEYIAPVINAQSGTIEVRVRIANPEFKLTSGTRCSLTTNP